MSKGLQQECGELREAWLNLAYEVGKALGLIRLAKRRGWKLKPWVQEREERDESRIDT
jgi:hypothetical protein